MAVVERDGVAGVSHRSVAAEAGVPSSSALYYFATLDDLLVAALETVAQEYADRVADLERDGVDPLRGVAGLVVDSAGAGRARALAERELTTLASRRPALRPAASRWRTLVARAAAAHTDAARAGEAVVAMADGLCTQQLLGGRGYTVGEVHALLLRAARG